MNQAPQIGAANLSGLTPADQIDLLCDWFEDGWRRGETPQIDDFLDRSDAALRESLLVELLLVDRELRIERGEPAGRNEYLARYPEYSTVINGLTFSTIVDQASRGREIAQHFAGGQFAHFELIERLGEGASGTVWKAVDAKLRRHVALKLPRQQAMTEPERARFRREGQACAQLRHPNIVTVYEVGEEDERLFIASELVEGWNLREWLAEHRRLSKLEAVTMTVQLADALQHAHERGVIHRDLKPANVLIDRAGMPYVTDFGLAKWTDQSVAMTVEGHLLGTPAYMSPEQARGDSLSADQRSDVYGLGALFYEMLTGRAPFAGDIASVIHQVVHDEPIAPRKLDAKIPRDLETICLKAMQKSPGDRYPSMKALADDLRRYLRGESIHARPAGMLKRGWRLVNRRKALTGMVAACLLAAGAFAAAYIQAEKNYKLQGFRTVTINTDPPGARVAFIPLSTETGEPEMDRKVLAPGFSPVEVDLLPGDYFVVAVMKDGRFHEVYRHVPGESEATMADYSHLRFETRAGSRISLTDIALPPVDVSQGMTRIEGHEQFAFGFAGARGLPAYTVCVAPFLIDNDEFTWREYKNRPRNESDPNLLSNMPGDEFACPVTFDSAMETAESLGKRLPIEVEYEYVATNKGTTKYPWGEEWPKAKVLERTGDEGGDPFGPVGTPAFDRVAMYPKVIGLCTNKAEWLMPQLVPTLLRPESTRFRSLAASRVFRGGSTATIAGDPRNTAADRDPRQRGEAIGRVNYPGLGFRCVRSVEPRVKYVEFE